MGSVRRVRIEIAVDRDLGQQRTEHLQQRLQQQKNQRERHIARVGAHVAQQAAHQAGVVCLTEDLFFHFFQCSVARGLRLLRTKQVIIDS